MKIPLNVFFVTGKFFIPYFTVSLTSFLETNKNLSLNIYLIYDFDDVSLLNEVVIFTKKKYGIITNLIYQDSSLFDKYRIAKHVPKQTYLRLLIAEIIPANIDSGLFIDSDTIITGSLKTLANITFPSLADKAMPESRKYIYAVSETKEHEDYNANRITNLGFDTEHRYFNAGVMLISLKNWRLRNVTEDLMKLTNDYMNSLVYWDQDVLNMYFARRWTALDSTYNAVHLIWKRRKVPLIIHFAGTSKPWNYLNRHPYKYLYFKYLKLTPYSKEKFTDFSYKDVPYKYYCSIRHFLNYFRIKFLGKLEN